MSTWRHTIVPLKRPYFLKTLKINLIMGKKLHFYRVLFLGIILLLFTGAAIAQCPTEPTGATSATISLSGSTTICSDESISFTSNINFGGGTNPTYQWQVKLGSGAWTDISGATAATLTGYSNVQNNSKFRLEVLFCAGTTDETSFYSNISNAITVNQATVATASISSNFTSVCPGTSINFSASLTNQGSSPSYSWRVNNTERGTGSTFSYDQFSDGDSVQLFMTSNRPCASDGDDSDSDEIVESNSIIISLKPAIPDEPSAITGNLIPCPNTAGLTYQIDPVSRATSYQWTLPSGWTGNSATNSITVTSGAVASNQVIKVKAINECGESDETELSVNVGPGKPTTPSAITIPALICEGETVSLSVTNDADVNSYTWSLPGGWSISSGQGTNQLTAIAGNFNQGGNVSVYSTNDCFDSDTRTANVNINDPIPNDPGPISGDDTICPNSDVTYTIGTVNYADEYIWYLDGTIITGQNGASVTFNSGAAGGKTLKVIAVNECVDSADYSSITGSSKSIIVDDGEPDSISISGPGNETAFCENSAGLIFSVPADNKADNHTWAVPSGWSIISGQGTNQITVTAGVFGNNGNITVEAISNDCGSQSASYAVSVKDPAPVISSQSISGDTEVCHNSTGLIYSIPAIQYATDYTWTLPANWSITTGSNTNQITVNAGTGDGDISVLASNECGDSAIISLSVISTDAIPTQPGTITGLNPSGTAVTNICPVINGLNFSIAPIAGADSYVWDLPAGWIISSGDGTENITVNVPANSNYPSSVFVRVAAANICGQSSFATYYTDINNTEGINIGNYVEVDAGPDQVVCRSRTPLSLPGTINFNGAKLKIDASVTTGTGSITNVPNGKVDSFNLTYTPSQNDIDNLSEVIIKVGPEVSPNGSCTGDFYDEVKIIFRDAPSVSIAGDATICEGTSSTISFTGLPNTLVTYKINNGSNQTINIGDSGEASLDTGALNTTTTYNLVSAAFTDAPTCSGDLTGTTTITVTPTPTATISYPDACSSATSLDVTLTGSGAYTDGEYSANNGLNINATTGTINPINTPGSYTITYTIPALGGCDAIPVTTDITIYEKVIITTEPEALRLCEGEPANFEVVATGDNLTYQWYKNAATDGNQIAGATQAKLSLNNITATDAGDYFVVVSGNAPCEAATSMAATLEVDQNIQISTQPADVTVCEDGSSSFSVTATSGGEALTSAFTYAWFKGSPGSGVQVAGANSSEFNISNTTLSDAGDYYVEITGPNGFTCAKSVSGSATLTVKPTPTLEVAGTASICSGNSADITFSNGIPNGIVSYIINNNNSAPQTFTLDANGEGTLNTGILTATSGLDTPFLYEIQSVKYADSPECDTNVSGSVTITVAPDPDASISFAGDQVEFCTADGTTYTPILDGTGTITGGVFSSTNLNIDAGNGSFVPSANNPGDYTIKYDIPAYGGCAAESITLDISIYEKVVITSQPLNIGICSTQNATFSITATGDSLTYQWYKDGTPLSGATSATLSLPVATSENAGEYYVRVSGTNACTPNDETVVNSDVVTLNVDEDIVILEPAEDQKVCETGDATVSFRFIVHANGAPLQFEWIKANGDAVVVDGTKISSELNTLNNYQGLAFPVYEGILTINNITESDEGAYAVKVDGSENNFNCPEAISNSFNLEVDPLPDPPAVVDVEYCIGETATALTATGTDLLWYANETDTTPLTAAPVPNTDSASETTYWVSQTQLYCESNRAPIKVTVFALPGLPVTEAAIQYCLGDETAALTATADTNATINWYDSASSTTPLDEAPQPATIAAGTLKYWVSQTNENDCEGSKVEITVTINDLPDIAPIDDTTICSGDSVVINAVDNNSGTTTFSWDWTGNTGTALTGSSQTLSPSETTTYTITATNSNTCTNTEEFTINVDQAPIGGSIDGPDSLCVTNTSGNLTLSGHSGSITRWEYKDSDVSDWTAIPNTENIESFDFGYLNLQEATSFRVVLENGICDPVFSTEANITIDQVPQGGELGFGDVGRVFLICENPTGNYAIPLNLTNQVGTIEGWRYRTTTQSSWSTVMENGNIFVGTTLTAEQIQALNISETTVFQVEISSGACTPNVFSRNAIISVIPSDITPTPVSVNPDVICFGDEVTLSSGTGYGEPFGKFEGGAFDNSSIAQHGWRVRRDGNTTDLNFDSSADNIRPSLWLRATPHDYITAQLNSPYSTSLLRWDSSLSTEGNKGIAIVSGNNPSTLETPVFGLGGLDEAVLTFDQAYNLTPGSSVLVELSTNGGTSYNTVMYSAEGPEKSGRFDRFGDGSIDDYPLNKIVIDLGDYLGQSNLRIRFHFLGTRDGDVWALDNIKVPEGPQNIALEWRDYSDPENFPDGEFIGNNYSEQWEPKLIGWNTFEVRTKIIFDSNGNSCTSAENFETIDVYAFDHYTSTATAVVAECGSFDVQLTGSFVGDNQGTVTTFPDGDDSTIYWEVVSGPADYTYSASHFTSNSNITPAINDPSAIFTPDKSGEYTLRWFIDQDEDSPCETTYETVTFTILDCSTLDFDGINDVVVINNAYSGAKAIEAWVRPESLNGPGGGKVATIMSSESFELYLNASAKPVFKWNGRTLTSSKSLQLDDRWYHLAIAFEGTNAIMYIDGIEIKDATGGSGNSTASGSQVLIGARFNGVGVAPDNHFSGWIEEVRIWNTTITQKQIQFMMNQRLISNGAQMGEQIPMPVPEGLTYTNLLGYYRLISANPDPAGLVNFDAALMPANGYTPDLATSSVPGRLQNMTTDQENTAPLPYISARDGQIWSTDNTWIRPTVWDPPNSNGVDGTPIEWNIVITRHNIDSGDKDITVLGLKSETAGKLLKITHPGGSQDENNTGHMLRVTHYLLLNGNMDLVGESQLLQDFGSLLAEESGGWLERDQQGKRRSYNYNYWSSPVSLQGAANNSAYNVGGILLDGTTSSNPKTINFRDPYPAADGARTNPITVSNYWIWKFYGTADIYEEWYHIGSSGSLKTGEGFTMKGTEGSAGLNELQNYVFKGKPHNGEFTLSIGAEQNHLIGNPYPSAMSTEAFILSNMKESGGSNSKNVFNGVVYFWDHFAGQTHILKEYIGGYATRNLLAGVPAISTDERILNNEAKGSKIPGSYIPVAQGFFVSTALDQVTLPSGITVSGGDIIFSNAQRVYKKENGNAESNFLKPKDLQKGVSAVQENTDTRQKIRFTFHSPTGYHRQILVGVDPRTTSDFDLGFDAPLIENNAEDMYWLVENIRLVIQGVPDFNRDRVLPFGIKVRENGYFKIQIDSLENIPDELSIYLKDKKLDTIHDLRIAAYDATSAIGEQHDRFEIVFSKEDEVIPIDPDAAFNTVEVNYYHNSRELRILNPELIPLSKIIIFDMNGKRIQEFDNIPLQKENIMNTRPVRTSIYIVKVIAKNGSGSKKFIMK